MHTLPQQVDSARYWQELYRQPLLFWQAALDGQRAECVAEMRRAGVADMLVQEIETYLDAALWDTEPPVLLHGDLTDLNMLVVEQAGSWRITGLIDWGDAKLARVCTSSSHRACICIRATRTS
jgi:aminoglycoside phosphotransferase (APT) family kinase protein